MKLSNSQEDYLKAIYMLSTSNSKIRVTDIANTLNITKPSVTKALKVLNEINLINYKSYGYINLTDEGLKASRQILKRYDMLKIFLKQILNVNDNCADIDAANIKSVISEETENKLEDYIIKTLNLSDLKCAYDMNNERCRKCMRITNNSEGRKN